MSGIENLLGSTKKFLRELFDALEKDGVDVSKFELDHICYRVETNNRYDYLKEKLSEFGELLSEARINGRLISNFKLNDPIIFGKRKIPVLELPAPRDDIYYSEGYEHAEFVVGMNPAEFRKLYPRIKFDIRALSKEINPDVTIRYDGFCVKFHEFSLEYVIKNLE